MKLINIIKGWWLFVTSNNEANDLNERRKQYCIDCPIRNAALNICSDCGCFLPAKRRVKEEACPKGKW